MKNIIFFLLTSINYSAYAQKAGTDKKMFTLSGIAPEKINHLYLYYYKDPFHNEYISEINIKKGEFVFTKYLDEVDTYMIIDPNQDGFLLFIWDGNVNIEIDNNHISKSKTLNSPLTNEMQTFNKTVIEKYVKPIWKLDTLIKNLDNYSLKDSLIKVKNKRDELLLKMPDEVRLFTRQYVKENSNSFVSLYELVYRGVVLNEQDGNIIKSLPANLKQHSRFKELINRSKE